MEKFERHLPPEEQIEDGRAVLIREKTLYHGTGEPETIEQLHPAEETTIGEGVYFTSKKEDAAGYAKRRVHNRGGEASVYEGTIENLKLLDLRNDDTVQEIITQFLPILEQKHNKEGLTWTQEEILSNAISKIKGGQIRSDNLRDLTFSTGKWFTEYLKNLGYDGLIGVEGGEGNEVGAHDSYLIFDPEKVQSLSKTSL